MSNVYALWQQVDAYEGEDKLLGLYSSYALAKGFRDHYLSDRDDDEDELYITVIGLDENAQYDFSGSLGKVVDNSI